MPMNLLSIGACFFSTNSIEIKHNIVLGTFNIMQYLHEMCLDNFWCKINILSFLVMFFLHIYVKIHWNSVIITLFYGKIMAKFKFLRKIGTIILTRKLPYDYKDIISSYDVDLASICCCLSNLLWHAFNFLHTYNCRNISSEYYNYQKVMLPLKINTEGCTYYEYDEVEKFKLW